MGCSVEMNDTGAALAGIATDMRAGEPALIAQKLHQQRARLDLGHDRLAVDFRFQPHPLISNV